MASRVNGVNGTDQYRANSDQRKDSVESESDLINGQNPSTNRSKNRSIVVEYARKIVQEYMDQRSWYKKDPAKWEASCDALAEFLRFIPRPTVDHVKIVFDVIESQSDWDVLIETTELLTNKYEDDDNIRDWERYALSALRQNLEN